MMVLKPIDGGRAADDVVTADEAFPQRE